MCTQGELRAWCHGSQLTGSCATTGEGLFEGLQWLSQNVKGTKA
jgi:hypothetical protein